MKNRFSRLAAILATLAIGVAIGYACNEAANSGDSAARAAAQADRINASKVPAAKTPAAKTLPKADKAKKKVQRFGQVIGLKPSKQIIYNMLHAHPWKPINKMIRSCNIQNYSIYETELDGKLYLFAYFEYTGDDFEADTAKMAEDETTRQWWKLTDPCQIRLEGTPEGDQWKATEEVYHLD